MKQEKNFNRYVPDQQIKLFHNLQFPSALLVGMQTGEATVENSMEFPQKTKTLNF